MFCFRYVLHGNRSLPVSVLGTFRNKQTLIRNFGPQLCDVVMTGMEKKHHGHQARIPDSVLERIHRDSLQNPTPAPILDGKCDGKLEKLMSPKGTSSFDCDSAVMCLRYSPDGKFIAAGLSNGTIKLIDDKWECVYQLSDDDTIREKLPVTSITMVPSPSNNSAAKIKNQKVEQSHMLYATYASGYIKKWHFTSPKHQKPLVSFKEDRTTLVGALNPSVERYITGGNSFHLKLYDTTTSQLIRELVPSDSRFKVDGHHNRVFAIQYHPRHDNNFLSGGWDNTVLFWDDRERHCHPVRRLSGPHVCGDGIDIDPSVDHVLTSSWRNHETLQIWDYTSGELIKTVKDIEQHMESPLYCCQWLDSKHIVCGGCEVNKVKVLDRTTLAPVGKYVDLPAGVYCLDNNRKQNKPSIAFGAGTMIWQTRIIM